MIFLILAINVEAAQFQPIVRTLERDVVVYHYGSRGEMGTPYFDEVLPLKSKDGSGFSGFAELDDPLFKTYFKKMSQNFENAVGPPWWVGFGGLYTAMDPVSGMTWLGNPGFGLEIKIPKGTKYLEIGDYEELIDPKNPKASQLQLAQLLRKNDIGFISYYWSSGRPPLIMCEKLWIKLKKKKAKRAFVFTSDLLTDRVEINGYVQKLDPSQLDSKTRDFYAKLLGMISIDGDTWTHKLIDSITQSLGAIKLEPPADLESLIREQTFRCNRDYASSEF